MNKKVKLGLGGLGFLGANGAIIPNLENSLNSLKSLSGFNSGGGTLRTKRDIRGDSYQLKFGNNSLGVSPQLTFQKESLKSSELKFNDIQEKITLSLGLEDSVLGTKSDSDYFDSIKTILEEITKEIKAGLIKQKADSQYESLVKKYLESGGQNHQTLLKELQSAKKIIED